LLSDTGQILENLQRVVGVYLSIEVFSQNGLKGFIYSLGESFACFFRKGFVQIVDQVLAFLRKFKAASCPVLLFRLRPDFFNVLSNAGKLLIILLNRIVRLRSLELRPGLQSP